MIYWHLDSHEALGFCVNSPSVARRSVMIRHLRGTQGIRIDRYFVNCAGKEVAAWCRRPRLDLVVAYPPPAGVALNAT